MSELRAKSGVSARALEFAILTAGRTGEVIGAKWSEVDLDGRVWAIPAEWMKAGREHRVPLSDGAIAVLKALPSGSEFVFAREGNQAGGQAPQLALAKTRRSRRHERPASALAAPGGRA